MKDPLVTAPMIMLPMASLCEISLDDLNRCLVDWGHRMGPINRPFEGKAHGLFVGETIVAVASTDPLISPKVAGIQRENAIELSRMCASSGAWNRVILRLWREVVFPQYGREWGISYQHAMMHTGNIYRFDGWKVIGKSRSGTDQRSGRKGYSKNIWGWNRQWS